MPASIKRIALVVAFAVAGSLHAASAATPANDAALMDALRQDLAAGKRAIIEKNLRLTPSEASRFWPLYERYEHEVATIVSRQNRGVLDFVEVEPYLTNTNAKRIAQDMLRAESDEQRLRDKLFRKVLSILPGKKAVRYIQLETRIQTLTRYDMAQRLPLAQ